MERELDDLIARFELDRVRSQILQVVQPCVAFELTDACSGSQFGGKARVPADFAWPNYRDRPLDFILALDLVEVNSAWNSGLVPLSGTLAFFYDLDSQPWGYDPAFREAFRVAYFPPSSVLSVRPPPNIEFELPQRSLRFSRAISVPVGRSRAFEELLAATELNEKEFERYWDFSRTVPQLGRSKESGTTHQLFGHSLNIQDDMQLEAELVSNGLYCGDPSGYDDPRRVALEATCAQWLLLLQIDSDESVDIMWGDGGLLYYWMREADLRAGRFEQVWGTMQCH